MSMVDVGPFIEKEPGAPLEKDWIVNKGIDDPIPLGPNENIDGLAMRGITGWDEGT